jgi:isopenicillin-N epimerase
MTDWVRCAASAYLIIPSGKDLVGGVLRKARQHRAYNCGMTNPLQNLFLLDRSVVFLNHGSFGACPAPVFQVYQDWQRRLEAQPVLFLGREWPQLDREARQALGGYLNADGDDLVFVPNVTHGVNIAARSLALQPGDEILSTDHEYGACCYTWEHICRKSGAMFVQQHIPLPANSAEELLEQFWQGVTPRTRVIYLSHISSFTALRLPVEGICARARQAGIVTVVDGAHAPGQIALDLRALDADIYTGNCHKWMLSPKGAGFLYVRRELQERIEPLVVSWGYHTLPGKSAGSQFLDNFGWTGTTDPAAYLSVPAAIRFMQQHDWDTVRQDCHALLQATLPRIRAITGMPAAYPDGSDLYAQMAVAVLPPDTEIETLKLRFYADFRVEVPLVDWNGVKLMRISVQAYNTPADMDALVEGVGKLIRELRVKSETRDES